jgi:hypothetical protein
MVPLKFYKELSKSNPLQVGANHLGYIANQIAKMLFFKKTMTFFYIIMIVLLCVVTAVSVQEAMWLQDLHDRIPKLEQKIDNLANMTSTFIMGDNPINGTTPSIPPFPSD